VDGEIFTYSLFISKEKAWLSLGVLSILKSATKRVHEVVIICISILSMKLRVKTGVQVHIRES